MHSFQIVNINAITAEMVDIQHSLQIDDLLHENIGLGISYKFRTDEFEETVSMLLHIRYVYNYMDENQSKKMSFLHFDVEYTFGFSDYSKVVKYSKTKEVHSVDLDTLISMLSVSISSMRGYIYAKSADIVSANIPLPVVTPSKFIRGNNEYEIKGKKLYFDNVDAFAGAH